MKNPWEEISLSDYENHMKLDLVMQLQAMDEMMEGQLNAYPVSSVAIFGIAGGNGLEHVKKEKYEKVYGIDINATYLEKTQKRYTDLNGVLECLNIDLIKEVEQLPHADLIIANLLVEYIGYDCFQKAVRKVTPGFISCIIQINMADGWVSDSPYLHSFDGLDQVHNQIEEQSLKNAMLEIEYNFIDRIEHLLPNGKNWYNWTLNVNELANSISLLNFDVRRRNEDAVAYLYLDNDAVQCETKRTVMILNTMLSC